jgi:hypothetical protein
MSGTANQNFKLDTSNYIGFEYKKYLTNARALALTEPTKYAKLRNVIISKLTDQLSKDWYNRTYEILSAGTLGGSDLGVTAEGLGNPSYPAQELAKLALSHTQTIVDMMDEIVDLLIPEDYLATAIHQMERKRDTAGISVAP